MKKRGKSLFFTDFRSGTPLKLGGLGGGIIYSEIELKVGIMITIRVAFDWMCCSLNKEGRGGRRPRE